MVVIRLRCSLPAYHSKPSLICDFCPSDQRFAYSFLQIPPHGRHPCCLAIHFPLPGHVRDSHPLERAHGAQTKKNRLFMRLFQIKVELTGLPVFLFFTRIFLCLLHYFVVYLSLVFFSFPYITILCIICASRKGARLLFLAFLYVFSYQLLQVCVGRGSFFVYLL